MKVLYEKIALNNLQKVENVKYFPDMVKCVVDIEDGIIALNAEMHVDLEQFLINDVGSKQTSLYGINIYYDDGEVEFDSAINPPRNRDAGYPKVGRYVADPEARFKIMEVVRKWIEF
ncbi:MAG: DUF5674 family protein [Clostridiales Family XIII bacterium]|nr:DUF5674 family protein [Clostridiales Family XIII bacterium]